MCVCLVWRVMYVLCWVCVSVCVDEEQYEVNYTDNYDNEITQDKQEGESPVTPCEAAELSRWDKLFVAMEDSQMRQSMLLEAMGECCGGMASLRAQVERVSGACQQCVPVPALESLCLGQVEQVSLRLQRGLMELGEEGAERERRINAMLQQLLESSQEQSTRLTRLEEVAQRGEGAVPMGAEHGETGPSLGAGLSGTGPIGARPGSLGAGLGLDAKPFPSSSLKEQEVTLSPDGGKLERALVVVATELQRVQAQLSRLTERGMTEGGRKRRRREAEGGER